MPRKSNGVKNFYTFFILTGLFIFQTTFTLASSFTDGLKNTGQVGAGYSAAAAAKPGVFLAKMLGTFLAPIMMGVFAMILFIYGGYTWMTARGEEQKVQRGKAIIINTMIALVLVFSAYAIVKLIIPLWQHISSDIPF